MKCPKCGFIHNGDLKKCPYCGFSFNNSEDFLSRQIKIKPYVFIKTSSILQILLFNIFVVLLFVDAFVFHFSIGLTFYAFIVLFAISIILRFFTNRTRDILVNYFRIDFYLFLSLLVAYITLGKWYIGGNLRPLIGSAIIPIYFAISSIVMTLLLIIRKQRIRYLEYVLAIPMRFVIITIIFIFSILFINNVGGPYNNLYYVGQENIFPNIQNINEFFFYNSVICFVIVALITINFLIFASIIILNKVRYSYGETGN